MQATRRYAQAQNETASPERTMVLLFEAALRHMRTGAVALEEGRNADANVALPKAADIVLALHQSFDAARAPDLAENVGAVYRFVCDRLVRGNLSHDPALVREAERVFAPVADAFTAAVAQTASARAP